MRCAMSDPIIKQKILKMLENRYPKDFSIKEIAEELHHNRGTISTYLKVLVAEGKIYITRTYGKMNLYSILKKNNV
ncbi:hypothetical protein LCGC14_1325140 [marine sediment metagenome]|uniref:Helix-turn-helix type 11 domain-containing protein n=1 Tax=marine sediment metagenome TaxID=412755 RepID=A0A0F9L437_9ZZZZ